MGAQSLSNINQEKQKMSEVQELTKTDQNETQIPLPLLTLGDDQDSLQIEQVNVEKFEENVQKSCQITKYEMNEVIPSNIQQGVVYKPIDVKNCYEQRDPTEKQLCECIILLKRQFPWCKLDRTIEMLYKTLIVPENQKESKEKQQKRGEIKDFKRSRKCSDDSNDCDSESESSYFDWRKRNEYLMDFDSNQANPRFFEQKKIAKLFCAKGYGYPLAREQFGGKITPNRYNNVITTIVRLSYRRLQHFVINNFISKDYAIEPISREELRIIKTPLVNCRSWLKKTELVKTFHIFVKLTYKISKEEPNPEYALKLYLAIIRQLQQRRMSFQPKYRRFIDYDSTNWTLQMDKCLCLLYIKYGRLQEIKQDMQLKYPFLKSAFDLHCLKSRLEKLIRMIIRDIKTQRCLLRSSPCDMPEISSISDRNMKQIMRAAEGLEARLAILNYFLDKDNSLKLRNAILLINQFLVVSFFMRFEEESEDVYPQRMLKIEQKILAEMLLKEEHKMETSKMGRANLRKENFERKKT